MKIFAIVVILQQFIEHLGADNLLFETDFPHPTSLYPAIHSRIERVMAGLPVDVRRKVLQTNAGRLIFATPE